MSGTSMCLPASATLASCTRLAHALPGMIAAGGGVLRVDASAVRSFDSAAISLLLHARRLAQAAGGSVEFTGLSSALLELARLYGVDSLLVPRAAAT